MFKIYKKNKCKKGSSLVLIIFVSAILAILSAALFGLSLSDTKNSVYQNDKVQAHYIGRSGIDVGMKVLKDKILNGDYVTIDSLATSVNAYVTSLGAVSLKDSTGTNDIGNFTLKYEKFGPDEIKIISKAVVPKSLTVRDTVTYIVKIVNSINFETNPADWFTGVNLQKGYGPNNDHNKGVKLGGKKTQSPKNGSASTFRSEIIYFLNNDDNSSFRQVTNSINVTFDAFILYLEGRVVLNKTNNPVYFTASQDVLTKWNEIDSGFNPAYATVGFENYNRYKDFVRNVETNDIVLHSHHDNYNFNTSYNYGIAYFGGDIVEDNGSTEINAYSLEEPRYYFFRSGVNLHSINDANKDLILIDNDDPIIEAVKSYFKYTTDTTGSLWNNK